MTHACILEAPYSLAGPWSVATRGLPRAHCMSPASAPGTTLPEFMFLYYTLLSTLLPFNLLFSFTLPVIYFTSTETFALLSINFCSFVLKSVGVSFVVLSLFIAFFRMFYNYYFILYFCRYVLQLFIYFCTFCCPSSILLWFIVYGISVFHLTISLVISHVWKVF